MKFLPLVISAALAAAAPAYSQDADDDAADATSAGKPTPIVPLSAENSVKTMQLPPGYHLQPVLTEPQIAEPVMISFDGDGRMFVVEMRTYMQDIDGTDERQPVSRVSLHWSSKADGVYDKHTVFADKLMLPRMLLPLDKGRAIIGETDTSDLYLYTDTDGDGVADKKELWFAGGPRGGNMEHQPNGLLWALDNGLYSTYNSYRLRWAKNNPPREPTAANNGQWGVAQDDYGKIWFVNAGGERGPVNFQVGIVYGGLTTADQFTPGFAEVHPLVGLADVQGGTSRFRPADKTLNHFTATCGGEIYRGDRLPAELKGNLFFAEPVGRLVRRTIVTKSEGVTQLSNPEEPSEFLRSTDPLFRPVNFNTAPDGCLYMVDMYRGIIQEGQWVGKGSYLRTMVEKYKLDKMIGRGRIYRLVRDGMAPGPQPRMNSETPAQLVAHLDHPNGWWRDTAQKLLVIAGDKSVAPALVQKVRSGGSELGRIHALWTLEGLGALTPEVVRVALTAKEPQIRAAGVRVSESLYKLGDTSFAADIAHAMEDPDADVGVQGILTARLLDVPDWKKLVTQTVSQSTARGVKEFGGLLLRPPPSVPVLTMTPAEKQLYSSGQDTFQTLCAACHGVDGKGMPLAGAAPGAMLAPPLAGSKTLNMSRQGGIQVLLHGLTGEIRGKRYEGQMISMANNTDEWIAGILSYARQNFGNHSGFIKPEEVARLRAETASRTEPWTIPELEAALPQPLRDRTGWKLTASNSAKSLEAAIDSDPRSLLKMPAPQKEKSMWVQVELPHLTRISGLQLDASTARDEYPRKCRVEVSEDGVTWIKPVAEERGSSITQIDFAAPAAARFVRVTQVGQVKDRGWSIGDLQIYAAKETAPPVKSVRR